MIRLEVTEDTAQALYTLMLHGLNTNSEMWLRVAALFNAMYDADIFIGLEPIDSGRDSYEINRWVGIPRFTSKSKTVVSEV